MHSTWTEVNGKLEKGFELNHFSEIINKLVELNTICDSINHHPNVFIHDYRNVTFILFTHSNGKITEKDYELSKLIDILFL